jgi:hypothetical protein
MDGISWTDLDEDEQLALAMLMEGVSTDLCDPIALLTLRRIGLVTGSQLTSAAEQLLPKQFGVGKVYQARKEAAVEGSLRQLPQLHAN